MTGQKTLRLVLLMALLSIAGIIGMLLVDSALDWLGFALAALPLAVGAWVSRGLRRGA
jgi:hypothetical protein